MTPEMQRNKQKLVNETREIMHLNCDIEFRQIGPHWGLYCNNVQCKRKGAWIQWIKQEHLPAITAEINK
jgi:hypothetical protein